MLHNRVGSWPCPQSNRQGWKGLPGTNTLAYHEITAVKSFMIQAPWGQFYKDFFLRKLDYCCERKCNWHVVTYSVISSMRE
jgi:hypothetical protein